MHIMNLKNIIFAALLAFVAGLGLTGCEADGPAEEAGEKIDDMVDDTKDKMEDAADDVEDSADELKY